MSIWQPTITLDSINQRAKHTLSSLLGIEFTEFGDDYLAASMPVDDRTRQPLGIMHGGASCVLAETVGSTAANCCVDQKVHYCVGLEINTNHLRSIREGKVIGTARPIHLGKSTHVWEIKIVNEEDKLISINRLTMMVMNHQL